LMADYKRRDASGQHADFGIGRRCLRMPWAWWERRRFICRQDSERRIRHRINGLVTIWRAGHFYETNGKKPGHLKLPFAKIGLWDYGDRSYKSYMI